jgi:hypothetical protein
MAQPASESERLYSAISAAAAGADPELSQRPPIRAAEKAADLADSLYGTPLDPHRPDEIFPRLRWGGQFVFSTTSQRQAALLAGQFAESGFVLTQTPRYVARYPMNIPLPFLAKKTHYFVARKTQLVPPGEMTERFTYHVFLEALRDAAQPTDDPFVVVKEVPSIEQVVGRLRNRWPDLPQETVERRARKFTNKIFPIFLTREAAILKIIHRRLPKDYCLRLPKVLDVEKDDRGYIRRLHLNWLRNGGPVLSQIEFARQSADLLRVLHDKLGVMHLDLRLDNFVITEAGVGFVDFGSAVRQDEDLGDNPLLSGLFSELMRTSEIQQMLFSMTRSGQVTSNAISSGLHKVDKAVDNFYLAVQMSAPHSNPDLKGLVRYNPESDEALALNKLTARILRPKDPANPKFKSASDIYRGIRKIEQWLGKRAVA